MDSLADAIAAVLRADPRVTLSPGPGAGVEPVECVAGRLAAQVAVEHLVGDVDGAALLLAGEPPLTDRRWRRHSG